MKTLQNALKRMRFSRNPYKHGHTVTIDRRTHDHLTDGWHHDREVRGRSLHWMKMSDDVEKFVSSHGGRIMPNDLTNTSTFYEIAPSEREQDAYMLHDIVFPYVESALLFKLTFL